MERGDLERAVLARGQIPVGVDEVGRGCIAGPVVTAAVVLDYSKLFSLPDKNLRMIRDSKTLSPRQRGLIIPEIRSVASAIAIASASVDEIQEWGILGATFAAMKRALASLNVPFDTVMVDGNQPIPAPLIAGREVAQQTVIKGDQWCFAIAAASIVAKESRDSFMQQLAGEFPAYGFDKHVGYGTREHIESLKTHGVTRWHRRGFEPIKSMCAPEETRI